MDRRSVGCSDLVDLYLKPEVHAHESCIVVALALGVREADEDAGVIPVLPAKPLELQNEVRWGRHRAPVEPNIRARHGLERPIHDDEPTRGISPRLVLDRRHPPGVGRKAVEEGHEAVGRLVESWCAEAVPEPPGQSDPREHRVR